jgi:acetylornithine deacetylase
MNEDRRESIRLLSSWLAGSERESIELLRRLISFDSRIEANGQTGKEEQIQKFVEEYLRGFGLEVDVFEPDNSRIRDYEGFNPGHGYAGRPNVIGRLRGAGGGRDLILNAHCDTVAPGDEAGWKVNPFGGEMSEGKVYGRGASDMKAGLASILWVIQALRRTGVRLRGDIIVESVVDEEGGGNGTLACVDRGYTAHGAVIAEPTALEVHLTNRGALLGELEVSGRPVHAGMREFGVNAIEKACRLIAALDELDRKWKASLRYPLIEAPGIAVGEIHGGTGASTLAGNCLVRFYTEFVAPEIDASMDKASVRNAVQEAVTEACAGDSWLAEHPVQVRWYQDTSTFFTTEDHPLPAGLLEALSLSNLEPRVGGFPSGCDAVYLSRLGKIPTVIFGPGSARQAHVDDEYVDVGQYLNHQRALAAFAVLWSG